MTLCPNAGEGGAQSSQGIYGSDSDSIQKSAAELSNSTLHFFSKTDKTIMFKAKESSRTDC